MGVKFTGAGLVVVEVTGRCGLHDQKPITSLCNTVKKTVRGMKNGFGKSSPKSKEILPPECCPPVSKVEYQSVVGVNTEMPSSIYPVPPAGEV